jgi:predicted RNA-binding Zn ribbon-like protein
MQPVFLGSHPALDFLNTSFSPQGAAVEVIGDGRSFLEWLVAAGMLDADASAKLSRRFGVKALDGVATEARKVRDWAREWLTRWRERPGANYEVEIEQLNKLLAKGLHSRAVVDTDDGLAIIDVPHFETAGTLLTPVAREIAALVTQEDPSLVRSCAGDGCTLWFLDRTKAHRRLFCSASACGNRAKVAAFRNRQRNE